METQHHAPEVEAQLEPQIPPAEQRYRRHLEAGCEALAGAKRWLATAKIADQRLEESRQAYDERVKSLIANDVLASDLHQQVLDDTYASDQAQRELSEHKEAAKNSFAAAYEAKPDAGKQILEGRVSISIRRSSVVHWDPKAAATEGKTIAQKNPLIFDMLFAPVKQGFKKLIGMGIPLSEDVMRIHPQVVVSFHGGDDMLRAFRNPFDQSDKE